MTDSAKFAVGQIVRHRRFGYRGVVADVDPTFALTETWYQQMATSRPPKDKPWYHVLVDQAAHTTYVAERNLDADDSGGPIDHPGVSAVFSRFDGGRYIKDRSLN